MKRAIWVLLIFLVLLLMLFYARKVYQASSAYDCLNLAFLYDRTTQLRIQIMDDMVPYIGLFAMYSLGILYVLNTAIALQRDFIPLVISKFNGRGEFILWNIKSILNSSIRFILIFLTLVLICLLLIFHTINEIYHTEFWLLMLNLCLTFAWIGHVASYVNLKFNKFWATISGFAIIAILFSVSGGIAGVAMAIFANLPEMERGSFLTIVLYLVTAILLKIRFKRIDI